ncbi:MAG: alcohol dehydrogenase catalytic domain-containing protein [Acidobacteria bacterium]|nr:alcohol dehydrogenase catalytic domain-containing protein [Acidobacteriota bacterium]
MKAAQVHTLSDIRIIELPEPEPGPGEIVVAMKAIGLCGSDIAPWYVATKAPAVLGHETAGVVVTTGAGVTHLSSGDRVFVHHHAPCGACPACHRGDDVMCPEWKPNQLFPGGLAERVRVGKGTVSRDTLRLPDSLTFEDGALVEPVACGIKAVDRASIRTGDTVFISGTGSNGILLALLARDAGATLVIGSDPDPARRDYARCLGFDAVIDPASENVAGTVRALTGGRGVHSSIVIPTAEDAVLSAIEATGPGGTVVFYSPIAPEKIWRITPSTPYFKDLTLRFSYSSGPGETRRALSVIERGLIRAETLVTHRLPLSETARAFAMAAAGGAVLKVMVLP